MANNTPDFVLGMVTDEIVAKASARIAIEDVSAVCAEWEDGTISASDLLETIVRASSLAIRAQMRGWDFLNQRKRDLS